mmetsp:Transcript_16875/g.20312  ORF Transcript_16875/g.20312 Transcript_16875/m.20312 type:complete len:129 (-) Transcript_16875:1478-1864(-)
MITGDMEHTAAACAFRLELGDQDGRRAKTMAEEVDDDAIAFPEIGGETLVPGKVASSITDELDRGFGVNAKGRFGLQLIVLDETEVPELLLSLPVLWHRWVRPLSASRLRCEGWGGRVAFFGSEAFCM